MDSPSDEQLVADFVKGRPEAFELLVRRHSAELYRFVSRFTNSTVAAEDVVQDAFLQAYTSVEAFDLNRRFKPWLFTIAANKARDWLRKRRRNVELPIDAQIEGSEGAACYADLLAGDPDVPELDEGLEQRKRRVRTVLDQLPASLREVLILAYYHRLPYRDIAEVLGIPIGTVKSRLHAAVGRFGEAYLKAADGRPRQD